MKLLHSIIAIALSVTTFASSAGVITLDTFNTPGPVLQIDTLGSTALTAQSGAGILGGSREMRVTKTIETTTGKPGEVNFQVANGNLSYNSGFDATGFGYIRWDGLANGIENFNLNANLTDLQVIKIKMPFSNGNFSFNISLWNSPTKYSSVSGIGSPVGTGIGPGRSQQGGAGNVGSVFPANHTFEFFGNWFASAQHIALPPNVLFPAGFSFASTCGPDGCVTFNDVDAITSEFGNARSIDFAVDQVTLEVPEPASLALAGMGLFGIAFARKRKQK